MRTWEGYKGHRKKYLEKLEKAVAVSGVCAGVLQESSGKTPGKNAGNIFPNQFHMQLQSPRPKALPRAVAEPQAKPLPRAVAKPRPKPLPRAVAQGSD